MSIQGRALHYVFKIGDRAKNSYFFRNILGMQVLRHEEFTEGCDAQCNGPYDNRWSKTMIGYGPESSHFVIELTYNYGVKNYEIGNDFGGITIKSKEVLNRARENNIPIVQENGFNLLTSPDGYKFFVVDEPQSKISDPVIKINLHSTNIKNSKNYWHNILGMNLMEENNKSIILNYGIQQVSLDITEISVPLNRAKAYGRIAFAVSHDIQPKIAEIIEKNSGTILTPLITLETPDKPTVRVIILADPDGHEICFVDEEGFSQLSKTDPNGAELLDKYIKKDPFQNK